MGGSDVDLEEENTFLETEAVNEEAWQEPDFVQDEDDKLNALADLIVEKLLASETLPTIVAASVPKNSRSDRPRTERDLERESRLRRNRVCNMADLINRNRTPLGLSKKSQFAEQYLKTIKLIYSELEFELGEKFFANDISDTEIDVATFIRRFGGEGGIAELLVRIETLVLVLSYSPTPAYIFDDESEEDLDEESLTQVKSRITALGHELLYLLKNIETIKKMNNGLYLSTNIQLFISFMANYKFLPIRWMGRDRNLMRQEISFNALNELNYILSDLKRAIEKGGYDKPNVYLPRVFSRRKEVESIRVKLDAKGVKEILGKFSKRLKDVVSYFKAYKSTSISLYRMRIWLNSQDDNEVSLDQCKKYFGDLNKQASKTNAGFEGYLNFFYIWDKTPNEWFQDIVLIIDSETLLKTDGNGKGAIRVITEEFQEFAQEYLDHRAEVIFAGQMKPQLRIEPIPLMYHLHLPSQLLIDVGDREVWKIFENSILPYFLYHELLELRLDDEVSSRFSRGTKKIVLN